MSTVTPSLGNRFVALITRLGDAIAAGPPRHGFAHPNIEGAALRDRCMVVACAAARSLGQWKGQKNASGPISRFRMAVFSSLGLLRYEWRIL
jgi:hypothetical protein